MQLNSEFDKLSKKEIVNGHIIQLFWILSSFIHACKEKGVVPIIYCQD